MSNTNGLTSLTPVYLTGAASSNIWASKIAPSIISPITVVSEDGTHTGIIQENDNGNMVIYPQGASFGLYLGNGAVLFPSPDSSNSSEISTTNLGQMVFKSQGDMSLHPETGSLYFLSPDTQTSTEFSMVNGGALTITNGGNNTVVVGNNSASGGAVLQINGSAGVGRVYDDKYNTLPAPPASPVGVRTIYTTPSSLITGTITEPIAPAVVQGIYMLQARVNLQRSQGGPAPVFGTSINSYLQTVVTPTQYLSGSAFNILPSMLFAPAENDDNDATFTSGAFVVPAGAWNLLIEVDGTWNFNSGAITFQLLRLA